ncbi:MAG: nucleotidyltransferase family protein [Deltaproteobacteria bacterium]|nr:nucleotidyltransferase family protein [Deltaproteobacteria bacterium]
MDLLTLLPNELRPLLAAALTRDPLACARALSAWHDALGPEGLAASPADAGLFLPLIADRILASPAAESLAPPLRTRLAGIRRQASVRNLQVGAALGPVMNQLRAAGLEVAVVGPLGPSLPVVPSASRVDLAVAPEDFARATTLLEAAGWRPHTPLAARLVRRAGAFVDALDIHHLDGALATPSLIPLTLYRAPAVPEVPGLVALAQRTLVTLARGTPGRLDPTFFIALDHVLADPNFDVHRTIAAAQHARVTLTVTLLVEALASLLPEGAPHGVVELRTALAHVSADALEHATLTRLLDRRTARPLAAWTHYRHAHAGLTTVRAALAFAPVVLSRASFRVLR